MKPMIIDLGLKPEKGYDTSTSGWGEAAGTCVPQRAPFGQSGRKQELILSRDYRPPGCA